MIEHIRKNLTKDLGNGIDGMIGEIRNSLSVRVYDGAQREYACLIVPNSLSSEYLCNTSSAE